MRCLLLTILIFVSIDVMSQGKWSKYDESIFKAEVAKVGVNTFGLNQSDAVDFANCCYSKASSKYSNPKLLTTEYVKQLAQECLSKFDYRVQWTENIISHMKKNIMSFKGMKIIAPEYRSDICNCMIQKIKNKYPKGISPNMSEQNEIDKQIGAECYTQIVSSIK